MSLNAVSMSLAAVLCLLNTASGAYGQTVGNLDDLRSFSQPSKNGETEQKAKAAEQKLSVERKAREDAERRAAELERKQAAQPKTEPVVAAGERRKMGEVFKDCTDCPEMLVIPPGSFTMGSSEGEVGLGADEGPQHRVTIGKAFALGKTEVTQGQWNAVMGNNPSVFKECGANCPVEDVSWDDAQAYVRKLSQKTGKTYRLPSEAEWEYACRAGSMSTYCGGESVGRVGWFSGNSEGKTHAVGQKQENAWGLYDMSGNVWEWVEDCQHSRYDGAPSDGGAWTSGDCGARVLRGGNWFDAPWGTRAASRARFDATGRNIIAGFRVARMLP